MKICIIGANYPAPGNPRHVFLEKLVKEFVDLGHECFVIAPQTRGKKGLVRELEAEYKTDRGNCYKVYSPIYKSFSGRKIGPIRLGNITHSSFCSAVKKVYQSKHLDCDVFYSHFISAGVTAYEMSIKYNKPFYIANGESDLLDFIRTLPEKKVYETYKKVSAIISVSTANKTETINSGYFPIERQERIFVIPNAINPSIFFQEDKYMSREQLGLPKDKFIMAFVGSFSERKGSKRVAEALKQCDDVYSIFIGSGSEEPIHDKCLFKGKVENNKIRTYLSAADVFVLPTLNEGCCNAIVEAMACGLPIISSDLPFNYDILDSDCSIMVNPNDINQIAEAIKTLKEDSGKRISFSKHVLEKVNPLKLTARAETILNVIENNK